MECCNPITIQTRPLLYNPYPIKKSEICQILIFICAICEICSFLVLPHRHARRRITAAKQAVG